MNYRSIALATVIASVAITSIANAGAYAYAADANSDLYRINLDTTETTLIGHTGQFLESLAYNPFTKQLYGADDGGKLYTIDQSSAASTLIGDTGLGNIEGMDSFLGFLFGVNFANTTTLYMIDSMSAHASPVCNADQTFGPVRAAAFDAHNDYMLMVADQPTFQSLWRMDPHGVSTLVGTLDHTIYGLDYIDGKYWGVGGDGDLYNIDALTGGMTLAGNTGTQFWLDITEAPAPVPEPASMTVLGLGALALIRRRRNR